MHSSPLMTATNTRTAGVEEAQMQQQDILPPYVLITPARNEEAFIKKALDSMIQQTFLPVKWVIVNDGSTDATASIVRQYLSQYDWIELLNLSPHRDRSFAAKVHAFNAGFERVKGLDYEIVGNLDSDIAFESDYIEFLLRRFKEDPNLGVAGTIFREEGYSSAADSFEGQNHVAGGCQLFRRQCFEEIGGYSANRAGGIDCSAVTTARMKGWKTRSFREKSFFHHRHLGTAERSAFAKAFSYGEKDYYLGGHPVWELFRVGFRMFKSPYFIEAFGLGLGYGWAALRRLQRPISKELMAFHRREQMRKLKVILKSVLTFKPIDKFQLLSE